MGEESNPFLLVDTSAQNPGRLKENTVATEKYVYQMCKKVRIFKCNIWTLKSNQPGDTLVVLSWCQVSCWFQIISSVSQPNLQHDIPGLKYLEATSIFFKMDFKISKFYMKILDPQMFPFSYIPLLLNNVDIILFC